MGQDELRVDPPVRCFPGFVLVVLELDHQLQVRRGSSVRSRLRAVCRGNAEDNQDPRFLTQAAIGVY